MSLHFQLLTDNCGLSTCKQNNNKYVNELLQPISLLFTLRIIVKTMYIKNRPIDTYKNIPLFIRLNPSRHIV